MSYSDTEYLIDEEGHVYRPSLGGSRWQRTGQTDLVAARDLQYLMKEAAKKNMLIRPAPWADITGRALYYDPRYDPRPEPQEWLLPILAPPEKPKMNSLASAARIFGFLSLIAGPFAPIALICGHTALAQIRDRGEYGRSEAMTGITIGWIIVGFYTLFFILIATH